jgi:hypothetical protein
LFTGRPPGLNQEVTLTTCPDAGRIYRISGQDWSA